MGMAALHLDEIANREPQRSNIYDVERFIDNGFSSAVEEKKPQAAEHQGVGLGFYDWDGNRIAN